MGKPGDVRGTERWKRLRKEAKLSLPPVCFRCGGGIDLTLNANSQYGPHLDHKIPLSMLEGTEIDPYDIENLAWSHNVCNKRHGAKLGGNHPTIRRKRKRTEQHIPAPLLTDGEQAPPRIESPKHPDMVGTLGPECIQWVENSGLTAYGEPIKLRPWQQHVLNRALEVDADGQLVWPTVVMTVPRQQGKSIILAALATWRMAQPEALGQTQAQILFTSNKRETAGLILKHAQIWADERPGWRNRYGSGREALEQANGSTWRIAAASMGAGTGTSNHLVLVDEAWQIRRKVYDDYLSPTMYARKQTQSWLVSTAGEADSDLLAHYRTQAIDGGNILIVEWSAHPNEDPHNPATWRACTPHWEPHTLKYLTQQHENLEIQTFEQQYLNRWVERASHWLKPFTIWNDLPPTPDPIPPGLPSYICIESDFDGLRHALVQVHKTPDGQLYATTAEHDNMSDVIKDAETRRQQPNTHLTITPTYGNRLPTPAERMVGSREMTTAQQHLQAAIRAGSLAHPHTPPLTEAIRKSRITKTQRGWSLSAPPGGGGVQLARALAFAIDSAALAEPPAPMVITRKTTA